MRSQGRDDILQYLALLEPRRPVPRQRHRPLPGDLEVHDGVPRVVGIDAVGVRVHVADRPVIPGRHVLLKHPDVRRDGWPDYVAGELGTCTRARGVSMPHVNFYVDSILVD